VFLGSDREQLHKQISAKCLPACYGGTINIPKVTGSQWLELLLMCDEEFKGTIFNSKILSFEEQ
jgi:hypothetical protein